MLTDHLDAITNISEERLSLTPPCPKSVKIELTARCNFKCAFCARSQRLREQCDIDRSLFERLLIEMCGAGVEEIGLFYLGESFLLSWLEDAIDFAKNKARFPYVFLTTNGSLATPGRVRRCMEAGLDSLKFSINYADQEQFKEVARVKPKLYDTMMNNVKAARTIRDEVEARTGNRCGLYGSYIDYDGDQGVRIAKTIAELSPYLDEIYKLPLYTQAGLVADEEDSRGWISTPGNMGRIGALRDPLPCWAVFTEGHITWDGKLSACCFDHAEMFHMGDLTQQSFMEAWHSVKFKHLRVAHLRRDVAGTVCERCVVSA